MKKKKVLITAGPTREYLDPVRYISNRSSGTLGYLLAEVARDKGYAVTLISGPTALHKPHGITYVPIVSARDLEKEVTHHFKSADALFMTSAVCDYRPKTSANQKIKRKDALSLTLIPNTDILAKVATRKRNDQIVCGFCIETKALYTHARQKLCAKNLDFIVATKLVKDNDPFGGNTMAPLVLSRSGDKKQYAAMTKKRLAKELFTLIEKGM